MQFNTFVNTVADLERCAIAPHLTEVLIEPQLLARQGWLSDEAAQDLAIAAHDQGLQPVLVWDALMPQHRMDAAGDRLQSWDLSPFAAIRVADPGAAAWAQHHVSHLPIHFIAETGNHNYAALQGWCDLFGNSLTRLVLSIELPEDKLVQYCQTLPVPCEVLGAGPILLFYSPRPLLDAHLQSPADLAEQGILSTTVAFDETDDPKTPSPPNLRPFPTVQTPHGTLMFLDKDQFILDRLDALKTAGLHTLRIDCRSLDSEQTSDAAPDIDTLCHQILQTPSAIRPTWPRPTRAPFFQANRTTALIPRMKSRRLDSWRPHALAEAIAIEKGQYVAFRALRSFAIHPKNHSLLLPTRDRLSFPDSCHPRLLDGTPAAHLSTDQVFLTDWIKRVVPGSLLLATE